MTPEWAGESNGMLGLKTDHSLVRLIESVQNTHTEYWTMINGQLDILKAKNGNCTESSKNPSFILASFFKSREDNSLFQSIMARINYGVLGL